MTVLLCIVIAVVAYGLGSIAVCCCSNRQPSGMPAVVRAAWQAVLRRVLGARPKAPRHRTTSGKGVVRHV